MMVIGTYLVDSDVFITAKNLYYSFDICPGFWKSVVYYHRKGRVFSIDRVRSELLAGHKTEDLVRWVRDEVPAGFFVSVDTDAVVHVYMDIMMWVQRHPEYFDHAKAKFAHRCGRLACCLRTGSQYHRRDERAKCTVIQEGGQAARCMRSIRSAAR